jgi:hypothetical protein
MGVNSLKTIDIAHGIIGPEDDGLFSRDFSSLVGYLERLGLAWKPDFI